MWGYRILCTRQWFYFCDIDQCKVHNQFCLLGVKGRTGNCSSKEPGDEALSVSHGGLLLQVERSGLSYIQPTSCSECAMAVRARVELLVTAQTSTLKVKVALFFFLTYSRTLGVQITNQELIGRLIQGTSRLEDSRGVVKTIAIIAHVIIIS